MSDKKNGIFQNKSFVFFAFASLISVLGDQLSLVAIPWLALTLTNDPMAVGFTLALIALPKTILLVYGGALTDKYNAKRILMFSRIFCFAIVACLAFSLYKQMLDISMLYVFAICFGIFSAIGSPASNSLIPKIVEDSQLKAANGVAMSGGALMTLLGPIVAGFILIAGDTGNVSSELFSLIFAIDAVTFLVSLILLFFVSLKHDNSQAQKTSTTSLLKQGFSYLKSDKPLISYITYLALVSFFTVGPVAVGLPIFLKNEAQGDALDFGTMLTVMNFGALLAMAVGAKLNKDNKNLMRTIIGIDIMIGVLMVLFVFVTFQWAMTLILFLVGMATGYIQLSVFTLVQQRVDKEYMGRVMSFLMFATKGLVPVSSVLAASLIDWLSAASMFIIFGILIASLAITLLLSGLANTLADKTEDAKEKTA